ncbi:MAG: carboxypeptidase-like regulatory domain-containing protein [Maribacter sp.]|uniref:carboxypeptidase-like regulatory domain-containing protein n=1 Tax=Maribacter sp. TaxID=1897614 RepID=UPI003C768403
MMKAFYFLFFSFLLFEVHAQMDVSQISGVVTQNGYPVSSASITVKGSAEGIYTNEKGVYRISAKPGDVLVFQHLSLQTVEVLLEDVTKTLNIAMKPVEVQLEEVVVKKNIRKKAIEREIEFDTNMDLIRTNLGILDTRKSGLSIHMINGEDLNKGAPSFLEAMRGKFIGNITYQGTIFDEEHTSVFLRTTTSLSKGQKAAIYDVDGVIMYSPPLFLTIQEIDRIAVIRGIGASGRYGRRGHGGVIVINTKRGKYKNPKLTQSFKDSLKRSRKRAAEAFATSDWKAETPVQLKDLYQCKTELEALRFFEKKRDHFYHAPYDAIEVGNYFINEWKNKEKANEIWNSVKKRNSDNAVLLKALAYSYEKNGELTAAMQVYQAVASMRPLYAQSYRDLAKINAELGRNKKALNLYAKQVLNRAGALQSGIDSIINIESHNLLVRTKIMEVSTEVIDVEQLLGYSPIRIVLEWNNGEAEFELQGMNPPSYYSWKHTYESDPERIMDEKTRGYSSKQFYLNQELGGKWRFNLKYLGNKSFEPTYLKTTVYFDYGKPSQRKETKVFRLQKENINRHLMTIDLDAKAVSS